MNEFMKLAIEEANVGIEDKQGGPFGAVIVKDGRVVGKGHNQVIANQDPTCHGEMMAIRDACKNLKTFDLSGCDIYSTGEPCPMCMGAVLWSNIDKVYYGCNVMDTENIGFRDNVFYEIQNDEEKRSNMMIELDRDQCLKLYSKYDKLNHTEY